MKSIRILLMIEDPAAREKFHTLLGESLVAQQEGIEIIGEPATVEGGLQMVEQLQPDLILLDENLMKASAVRDIDLARQFVKIPGPAKVLVLCERWNAMYLNSIRASGASWIIEKGAEIEDILNTIRQTITPDPEIKGLFDGLKSGFWSRAIDSKADLSRLTQREREVYELITQGKSIQHIAALLGISEEAVGKCRAMIFIKLLPEYRPELKLCPN